MIIEGIDYRIEYNDRSYTIFILKNKKEEGDQFKVFGYYISFSSVLKAVIKFRKSKKYPGNQKPDDIMLSLEEYKSTERCLNTVLNYVYDPILKLKNLILYNE